MLRKEGFLYLLTVMVLFIFILGGDYPCAAPTQAGFLPNDEAGLATSGGMGKINDTALSGEGYVIYLPVFYYNYDQAVAPNLTTQPSNQVVTEGQTANFSVTARGAELTYQWERWNGGSWEKVTAGSGGTTASYTTAPATAEDNGMQFRCVVTNSGGGVRSNEATLTVNPEAPVIIGHPSNQAVTEGQTAVFSVTATGKGLTYQWQRWNGGSWEKVTAGSGGTTASYTTAPTIAGDNGVQFRCLVTNGGGSAVSNAAALTINLLPPVITGEPANQAVTEGETAVFRVTATGSALNYQWQRWNGSWWEDVNGGSGGMTPAYATAATTLGDNGEQFRCLVTNSGGGAVSDIATLTVNPAAPVITGNPANQAVIEGHSATFTVIAVGTAPLTYQWQRQESLGNPWTNVGTNSSSYTKDPVTGQDHGARVRCQVRNQAGSVFSDTATLTVLVPPTVTSQPLNQTVSVGQKATFSVIAIGTAPLTYQWLRQEAGGGAWANVGTNSPTYTTDPARAADNGAKFQCLVTNTVGSVLCHEAILIIEYMPDWRGVASGPFDLAPYPFLNQPVLSAANVTDISASFVADPFLFYEKGLWYLFFEALETSSNLGRIGLATSPDGLQWTYRKIVLSEGFHLSYPQVFSYHGQHYMTPEVFQTNSVRLYRATNFPEGWTLVSTLVQGRPFVDPQILRYDNTWWLWVSDTSNSNGYLYYSDNLTGGWTEHPQSPVVRGTNQSRGGGRVFVYHGGTILRLAQDDSVSYGRIVRAFQVDTLTRTTYSEHEIPESPVLSGGSASWNQKGMHQLDPWWTGSEWICAVDGAHPVTNWSIGIYRALPPAYP